MNILNVTLLLIAVCSVLFRDLSDFNEEDDKVITEYTIRAISEHYSRENQLEKCKEELKELLAELETCGDHQWRDGVAREYLVRMCRCDHHGQPDRDAARKRRCRERADGI